MANPPALDPNLAETRRAKIMRIDRHRRRALGAAVSLEGPDAELLLERGRQPLGQLFRAHRHDAHAAELLRRATAHVKL